MLAVAFLVGIYLAKQEAARSKIPKEVILDLGLYVLISSIVGARLLYVLLNLDFFLSSPSKIIFLNEGGLVFYGGFITAIVVGFWYVIKKGLPLFKVADLVAPSVAVGQSIGRIGCLLYGCCYGCPTTLPWGMHFEIGSPAYGHYGSMSLHPTQIYSSLVNLSIFLILALRRPKARFEGEISLLYLILYGLSRFMIENLRGDNPEALLSLTHPQYLSLIIGISAGIAYLIKKNETRRLSQ